jgi:RNA polymerase sigma factor (sigma-70 family)
VSKSLESPTSPSLLGRLRSSPSDDAAWQEFVGRYTPAIYGWCRGQKLQGSDIEDVTQDVLTRLATRMRTFQYDSSMSFRSWLWRVTRNAVLDWKRDRYSRPEHTSADFVFESAEARNDLLQRLQSAFDVELLEEAYQRVQLQVESKTWEAFRLSAIEQIPGPEVAERLEMPIGSVYMARCNVQKRIRREIERLENQ